LVKARSIGTGIGAFFNNPGVLILGGLAIALLFFQKDIRGAFGSLGQGISQGIGGLGNIDITLPEFNFPDITFPNITFPSFDISNIFPSQEQFPEAVLTPEGEVATLPLSQPGEGLPNPADQPTNPTEVDIALSEGATPSEIADLIGLPSIDPNLFQPPGALTPTPAGPDVFTPAGINIGPFLGLEPTGGLPEISDAPLVTSQLNLGQEQPFTLAPLGAQTLTSIINEFDVTASQAANIKFISQQGGDPFATPENIFGGNPPAVSDPMFQGLTPEEIALQLTGGNISNF